MGYTQAEIDELIRMEASLRSSMQQVEPTATNSGSVADVEQDARHSSQQTFC